MTFPLFLDCSFGLIFCEHFCECEFKNVITWIKETDSKNKNATNYIVKGNYMLLMNNTVTSDYD